MTVSAMMLPPQKRAIVGAGKVGFARQPSGATIVIARKRPEFVGTGSCVQASSRIERSVTQIAMSTVPTSGMLIGRSTCASVPVRSTVISEPGDGERDLDREVLVALVRVLDEAVEMPLRLVRPVRELLDLPAEHPLGVVHQVLGRVLRPSRGRSGRSARRSGRRRSCRPRPAPPCRRRRGAGRGSCRGGSAR